MEYSQLDSFLDLDELNLDEQRVDLCIAEKASKHRRPKVENVKIISNWNFKGGVGKTTLTFSLAYALAHTFKKKVLMVDADPQKNLTQLVARFYLNRKKSEEEENDIVEALDEEKRGFHFAMRNAMERGIKEVKAAEVIKIPIENVGGTLLDQFSAGHHKKGEEEPASLFLLNGSYKTALIESWLKEGYEFDPTKPTAGLVAPYPTVFWNLVRKTAVEYGAEYVLVDLSPAISLLNTNILFSSDAFLLPCAPELFSVEALSSVPQLLKEGQYWSNYTAWKERFYNWARSRSDLNNTCPPLTHCVQFAGAIVTRFSYKEGIAGNFAPSSEEQKKYFRKLREIVWKLAEGADTPENLPKEMVMKVTELGWTSDDPFDEQNFRLLLTRLPEQHKLILISQNASIPSAYLPNRLLQKGKSLDKQSKERRWYLRREQEKIVRNLLRHFFQVEVPDEVLEVIPQPTPRKRRLESGTSTAAAVEEGKMDEEEEQVEEIVTLPPSSPVMASFLRLRDDDEEDDEEENSLHSVDGNSQSKKAKTV